MAVKNILFRLNIEGRGIVNYDDSSQKFMFKPDQPLFSKHNNVNYAKKRFYRQDGTDELAYKIAISSNCLRHNIFIREIEHQSPNISHDEVLFYSYIASPALLLRGYLNILKGNEHFKRSGVISITDAEQVSNAVSALEVLSNSGAKSNKVEDDPTADSTFFYKENVGEITYQSRGFIDLMGLQFVSCDHLYDRLAFNSDQFGLYKEFLSTKLPKFKSELGFYQQVGSDVALAEHGFVLSAENIVFLVKFFFERLLAMDIRKAGSYAKTSFVEYKLVEDPLIQTYEEEDGWIKIKSKKDIDKIKFTPEMFYSLVDSNKHIKQREDMNKKREEHAEKVRRLREEEKAKKDATPTKSKKKTAVA